MRNPPWQRDEIILALDLYFKLEPGQIHAKNPQIIELSGILNNLPLIELRPNKEKFRNPNGVSLKLSNFLALDETYSGKGMSAFSRLDMEVFNEFKNDHTALSNLSNSIKKLVANAALNDDLFMISDLELEGETLEIKEGKLLYKLHKYRERNAKIVKMKKQSVFQRTGCLACEVCGFDFFNVYGDIGKSFIECHHIIPLSEIEVERETRLEDLALVCANCHRMFHQGNNPSIEQMKLLIDKNKVNRIIEG